MLIKILNWRRLLLWEAYILCKICPTKTSLFPGVVVVVVTFVMLSTIKINFKRLLYFRVGWSSLVIKMCADQRPASAYKNFIWGEIESCLQNLPFLALFMNTFNSCSALVNVFNVDNYYRYFGLLKTSFVS